MYNVYWLRSCTYTFLFCFFIFTSFNTTPLTHLVKVILIRNCKSVQGDWFRYANACAGGKVLMFWSKINPQRRIQQVSRDFWRIAIVTRVLPSRGSEIRGAKVRIAKTNTILKHPVKKLFAVEIHMTLTKQMRQGNKSLDFEHYKYY